LSHFFSEGKYSLGFEEKFHRNWCCTAAVAYFASPGALAIRFFPKESFLLITADLHVFTEKQGQTALPQHGQMSDFQFAFSDMISAIQGWNI